MPLNVAKSIFSEYTIDYMPVRWYTINMKKLIVVSSIVLATSLGAGVYLLQSKPINETPPPQVTQSILEPKPMKPVVIPPEPVESVTEAPIANSDPVTPFTLDKASNYAEGIISRLPANKKNIFSIVLNMVSFKLTNDNYKYVVVGTFNYIKQYDTIRIDEIYRVAYNLSED